MKVKEMINTKFSIGLTYKTAKEKKSWNLGQIQRDILLLNWEVLSRKPFVCFIIKYNTAVLWNGRILILLSINVTESNEWPYVKAEFYFPNSNHIQKPISVGLMILKPSRTLHFFPGIDPFLSLSQIPCFLFVEKVWPPKILAA